MAEAIPLTDRAPDAVLFRLPGRDVTAAGFAADAQRLAAVLPVADHTINLCTGRYAFAVGFAASLLRGQASLLTSDRSPGRLLALATRFPGATALTDEAESLSIPCVTVPPPGGERAAIPGVPADRLAALVFTSGSTGEPAPHAKRWQALACRSQDAAAAFALDPDAPATVVATVPPQHMYGFETTVLMPLHAACAAWCGPTFYPADVRDAMRASPGPHVLVSTPLQLRALLAADTELVAMAAVISATAPLSSAMAEQAEQRWHTRVHEIFGATEVGSIASRRTVADAPWMPYARVRLTGTADGLLVEAPGVDPTVLDDSVAMLPGGAFRLLRRRGDVVKLGGRRASLAGLNLALAGVAGVEDGVFLAPDADDHRAAARMTAFVVAPQVDAAAILAALRHRIDPVFLPRRIVHVDSLPRNELGKLPLDAVRALAGAP